MSDLSTDQKRVLLANHFGIPCERCNGTGSYLRFGKHEWARLYSYGTVEEQQPLSCDHVTIDFAKSYCQLIPSYFTSLDAIAELEARLTDKQHADFREVLWSTSRPPKNSAYKEHYREYISATAAQRAEAIGLTLGLWSQTEDQP